MRKLRPYRPALGDRLEDRLVLSAVSASAAPYIVSHAQQLNLVGVIQGTTLTPGALPDAGTTTYLNGMGTVGPLGSVHASGFSQQGGFIRFSPEGGFLDLRNSRGDVLLQFNRIVDHAGAAPGPFLFKIVAGTGAYRGAHGSGTLHIEYGGPMISIPGPLGGMSGHTGTFVMSINEPLPPIALPL